MSEYKDLDEEIMVDSCRESSTNVGSVENVGVGKVIDIGRFSYLEKLLRATKYVTSFAINLKNVFDKGEGINGHCC